MIFWVVAALLSVAMAGVIARAVYGGGASESAAGDSAEIYRDQLRELDEDVARGVIGEADAQVARVEISRKLIAAMERREAAEAGDGLDAGGRGVAAAIVLVGIPALATAIYLLQGAPGLPALPYASRVEEIARIENEAQAIASRIAALEKAVADDPADAQSWSDLGFVYLDIARYEDAVRAFDGAIAAAGDSADLLLNKGLALVYANEGLLTPKAEEVFLAVLSLEPEQGLAHYFLGFAALQRGDDALARRRFEDSLQYSPESAPWPDEARRQLAAIDARRAAGGRPSPSTGATGTDEPQTMPPGAVEDMVARLASRLTEEPHDLDGWLMLVRSYAVLGDSEAAETALAAARAEFAGEEAALTRLDALAREFDLAAVRSE